MKRLLLPAVPLLSSAAWADIPPSRVAPGIALTGAAILAAWLTRGKRPTA